MRNTESELESIRWRRVPAGGVAPVVIVVFLGLLLVSPALLGCSDLGVQFGKDGDKKPSAPAYMDTEPEEYDPAMELHAKAYGLNFSFWQTNYNELLESLGGNVLAIRNSYEQGRKNLMRMTKYLGEEDRQLLTECVGELDKIYETINRGVQNRTVEMRLVGLERKIRGSFAPGVVHLVAPKSTVRVPPVEPPPETEAKREQPVSPLIGVGEKVSHRTAQPEKSTDPARFESLFTEWQKQHAAYAAALRKNDIAGSAEPYSRLLEALRAMKLLLRDEQKANHLQLYISEYERLNGDVGDEKKIERIVRTIDLMEKDIVAQFGP
ncbi:MAG: hypothetical protein RDV41_00805 [Planctomycetota bacterium]|nr:hypothetical protein [Planctomycetota bacterium]